MKRITVNESLDFVPLEEDFTNNGLENAEYFTMTPSTNSQYPSNEGWDDIKYFTARMKNIFANKGEGDQWVYILSNPTLPNLLKIGYTKLDPDTRAAQISRATGVPLPYKVEWAFKCFNGEQLEGETHRALKKYRVNQNREFFQISIEEAKKKVTELGQKYI